MLKKNLKQNVHVISVIIITWNRKNDILELLKSLEQQTFKNFEIIVIDQASIDGSAECIKNSFPDVRLVKLEYNHGVAGGRNIGFSYAHTDILVFLDDDAVLENNGIAAVWEEFSSDERTGIIAGKVIDYFTGELQREHWPCPDYQISKCDTRFETYTFSGGVHAIRKSVFEKVGKYDEVIFFGPEEYGLSMRAFASGYKIVYLPDFVLLHRGRARLGWGADRWRLFVEGKISLMLLYCPMPTIILVMIEYTFGYLIQAFKNFFLLDYVKAVLNVVLKFPKLIRLRKPLDINTFKLFRKLEQRQRGPVFYRIRNELFRSRKKIKF